ncbi:MAG: hypothetical protein HC941_20560 [Microcoleus sp. SU_5_3]|nr:hypothetical protein [Microcoleus sp. SU_5_3]
MSRPYESIELAVVYKNCHGRSLKLNISREHKRMPIDPSSHFLLLAPKLQQSNCFLL